MWFELQMPLQNVEEFRYVKHKIKKRYGSYGEKVVCAEHVKVMTGKGKIKERLLVIGAQRFYLFRKSILQDNVRSHVILIQILNYLTHVRSS